MTKLITALVFVVILSGLAYAGGIKKCYLPRDCAEVLDSEFSSGGGKSAVWYVEIRCRTKDGRQRIYIDGDWGIRVFRRFSLPKVIELVPSDKEYLDCKL